MALINLDFRSNYWNGNDGPDIGPAVQGLLGTLVNLFNASRPNDLRPNFS